MNTASTLLSGVDPSPATVTVSVWLGVVAVSKSSLYSFRGVIVSAPGIALYRIAQIALDRRLRQAVLSSMEKVQTREVAFFIKDDLYMEIFMAAFRANADRPDDPVDVIDDCITLADTAIDALVGKGVVTEIDVSSLKGDTGDAAA